MNLIINSWPGAGATTISLILSSVLDYMYIDVSKVFEQVVMKTYGKLNQETVYAFEKNYGAAWDNQWESYVGSVIENHDGLVIDSRISGFFIDSDRVFEIMLIAESSVRVQRASKPNEMVVKQDQIVHERWLRKYHIDIFNLAQIQLNYDLVVDTTYFDALETVDYILTDIDINPKFEIDCQ